MVCLLSEISSLGTLHLQTASIVAQHTFDAMNQTITVKVSLRREKDKHSSGTT